MRFYLLRSNVLFVVSSIRVLGKFSNTITEEVEAIRNRTASKSDESHQSSCPLITETVEHLLSEQHNAGSPEASNESLCRKSRCS